MTECNELAGRVVRSVRMYEDAPYGPELSIDFQDGTNFTATLHSRHVIEGKLTFDQGGEPVTLKQYLAPRPPL